MGFGWQTPGAWGRSGNHGTQSWYTGMSPFHSSRFRIDFDFHDLVFQKISVEVAFFKIYHFSLNPILLSQCSLGMYFDQHLFRVFPKGYDYAQTVHTQTIQQLNVP